MKKTLSVVSMGILLTVAMPAFAVNGGAGTQGEASQQRLLVSPSSTGNIIENQNQVKTQNSGEESEIKTNTQEQEDLRDSQEEQDASLSREDSPRSEAAQEQISNVATKVEEVLTSDAMRGGIGQQIKEIAQEQNTAQDLIQADLEKVDSRGKFLKSIVGPDYKAMKDMQKQIEQNQLRIQQLTELQKQLTNQSDINQVQEMIQAFIDQNIALQDRVNYEERSGSLLGWLFRIFAK